MYEFTKEELAKIAEQDRIDKAPLSQLAYSAVHEALQSNYRVSILLTDGGKLNTNILEVDDWFAKNLPLLDALNIDTARITIVVSRLTRNVLDLTTQAVYTGRCLNAILNPSASVHTKCTIKK
jgi:hypothetical protein